MVGCLFITEFYQYHFFFFTHKKFPVLCFMYWKPLEFYATSSVFHVFILQTLISLSSVFTQRLSQLTTLFLRVLGHLFGLFPESCFPFFLSFLLEYKNQQIKDFCVYINLFFLLDLEFLLWDSLEIECKILVYLFSVCLCRVPIFSSKSKRIYSLREARICVLWWTKFVSDLCSSRSAQ